jgi:RNase P/RNase MRP subunit p29
MARRANHDLVDVACSLLQETEKAWRLDTGDKTVWLPKSQCELDVDPASGHGTVTLPEWLALEKEII